MRQYVKTDTEIADSLGMSRQAFVKGWKNREGNPGKTAKGFYNVPKWLAFIKEDKEQSLGSGDLRDEKLKREIEKLDIQIAQMRGELVTIQEMQDSVVEVCRGLMDGLAEFEARASAEYPTEPRMVEIAQTISDRVKRTVQLKLKQTGEEDE